MNKKTRNRILIIEGILLVLIVGLLVLEPVVSAIPGRYRVALQERSPFLSSIVEGVIDQVAPMATALPVAVAASEESQVDINSLLAVTAVVEPTATVKPTETPTVAPETTRDEAATPLPTNTPFPTPTNTPTPEPLPTSHILEGMGVVRQSFNNCGPANLTQTLNYWGYDITQEEVADYLMTLRPFPERTDKEEFKPGKLMRVLAEKDFRSFKGCAACHRDAPDFGGVSGPELYTAFERLQPEYMISYTRNPTLWEPRSLMPNRHLPDEGINKLVNYLKMIAEEQK